MQNKTTIGYIINSQKYKENDSILTIFTMDGIKTVFGRGYRKIKSKYHSLNNILIKVEINYQVTNKDIIKIKDFNIVDYSKINKYKYQELLELGKIINLLKNIDTNYQKFFLMFEYILNNIEKNQNNLYYYWLAINILKENKLKINFNTCSICKQNEANQYFSLLEGGVICLSCIQKKELNIKEYTKKEIEDINTLLNGKIKAIEKITVNAKIFQELEFLIHEYYGF